MTSLIFVALSLLLPAHHAHAQYKGCLRIMLNAVGDEGALATARDWQHIGDVACGPICEYNLLTGLEETFKSKAGNDLTHDLRPAILLKNFKGLVASGRGTSQEMLRDDINYRLRVTGRSSRMSAKTWHIEQGPLLDSDLYRDNRAAILSYQTYSPEVAPV